MGELRRPAPHRFSDVPPTGLILPLDWNHWMMNEWPEKLAEIQAVTELPIWVSEVGVSSFGAEEVQEWGLRRTVELLRGRAPRVHWYSLYDLPKAWPATTRHREAEGSAYYRHFYMGLLREDGTPKLALRHRPACEPRCDMADYGCPSCASVQEPRFCAF